MVKYVYFNSELVQTGLSALRAKLNLDGGCVKSMRLYKKVFFGASRRIIF